MSILTKRHIYGRLSLYFKANFLSMYQSKLFTKTRKEAPADEVSKNAELLIRAGFIYKEMAGVYAYLPLGLRTLNKIIEVIREEMNAIGGQEVTLTALQQKETWEPTNQWSDEQVDVWFKTALKNGTELGLGVTHEAALTKLMKDSISSYRDLPQYVYQFQTKFRNETRAKSGIMRCREFIMKDLYSFSKNEEEHNAFYERAKNAYVKIYERLGLGDTTYLTFASGGMFSKFSHEFQTVTSAGEDIIYVDKKSKTAWNKEVFTDEVLAQAGFSKENLVEEKAVEVGNIFTLGTRFSEALGLTYTNEEGNKQPVFMGSYGIGPGRVMGTIVETLSDDKGIIWPEAVAPFQVHIISLGKNEEAKDLYEKLGAKGVEVLFDDRDASAGAKLADADLIGIPHRVLISDKSLTAGGVEYKKRSEEEAVILSLEELLSRFS
jgi:prolyl-tRNA synthetase